MIARSARAALPLALALAASSAVAQPFPTQEPPAAAPAPPPDAPARAFTPLIRIPRITAELVVGGASALGVAYGGYQLGCALSGDPYGASCGATGTLGALSGFALGIPIGVMLGGSLLDGDGAITSTALGTLLGVAAGLGGLYYIQVLAPEANPLPLALLPLAFAVVGYELSSHDSRTATQAEARGKHFSLRITPTAAFTHHGAAFGVSLLLP
jgi:hypothetical protein